MNKKGDFGWQQIGKIIIALAVLVILIIIIMNHKELLFSWLEKFADTLRFR